MKLQPMLSSPAKAFPPCITGIGLPDRSPPLLLCRQVTSAARDFYQSEASWVWVLGERTTWPATSRSGSGPKRSPESVMFLAELGTSPRTCLSILTHSHLFFARRILVFAA